MNFETENIEFKSQFTDEIYKEVIAFVNTDDSVHYIGINNEGNAVVLTDVDDRYTRITNGIRDAIMPDGTIFIRFSIQGDKIVKIAVSEVTNKSHCLEYKGLNLNDGDNFEEMRSMNQALTFEAASSAFKKYSVEFSEEKYSALGLIHQSNKMFTNLAFIISDQCEHTIKVAVFGDDVNTVFKDNKEFKGSIFKQLDDTFNYLMLCNKTIFSFKGLERIEKSDYPEEAIREALLNAIVHRDYSFSGSIIININDNEMEFISLGGLLSGLSPEDIRSGISQPRNKKLAEVFHRLHLIESYGTGIRKIYSMYANHSVQPRIEVTPNTFKIILPNMNAEIPSVSSDNTLTPQMEKIMNFVNTNGQITETEIQSLLGIGHTRAYTIAKQMCNRGVLKVVGRGVGKKYINE